MTFGLPWALALLVLIPPLWWWGGRRRARAALTYSSLGLVDPLRRTLRQRLAWLPSALLALAAATLIVALARPRFGIGEVRITANGIALMMVVDRSASMKLPISMAGVEVQRIDAVKQVFTEFVVGNGSDLQGRPEDLIGLVSFARYADTVCPLVRIHDTLVKLVQSIDLAESQYEGGTAIGDGLALAATRLKQAEEDLAKREKNPADPEFTIKSKAIVLLTDGDENAGEMNALDAADLAREWGIKIYVIGIGDERGGVIDTAMGRVRIQRGGGFDESRMKAIAQRTGGEYWRAGDAESLRRIYARIDELEKTEIKSKEYTSYREAFMPWAIAGAGMIAASLALSSTLLRRSP